MQDLRPAPPVADPHGPAAWGQQLVMGGSRIRATLSSKDAIQTGKEAATSPRVAESQARSRGRNIAG